MTKLVNKVFMAIAVVIFFAQQGLEDEQNNLLITLLLN